MDSAVVVDLCRERGAPIRQIMKRVSFFSSYSSVFVLDDVMRDGV